MTVKVRYEGDKDKYLGPGKHIVQIDRVFLTDKEGIQLVRADTPVVKIILKCIMGENEGKSHIETLFLEGKMAWKTIQFLKAVGAVPMDDEVQEVEFDEDEIKGNKLGIELERKGEYINVKQFLSYEGPEEDIPF